MEGDDGSKTRVSGEQNEHLVWLVTLNLDTSFHGLLEHLQRILTYKRHIFLVLGFLQVCHEELHRLDCSLDERKDGRWKVGSFLEISGDVHTFHRTQFLTLIELIVRPKVLEATKILNIGDFRVETSEKTSFETRLRKARVKSEVLISRGYHLS